MAGHGHRQAHRYPPGATYQHTELTDTNVPSALDTEADWGIHRYAKVHMMDTLVDTVSCTHADIPTETDSPLPGAEPR